ncbi:MAG: thioether cross-link-forming SCIFF peptide maturase [Oscillospiraceae bacterium]|jgi:uncharacterized protein|nr:thioether cross-link-forming SCIFF peptide maturase [Oscillospiraceae bacterium]
MIHKFKLKGHNIALDVESGAVHLVDDICFDLLGELENGLPGEDCPQGIKDKLSQYGAAELDEAYGELYRLCSAGLLFSEGDYEKYAGTLIASPIKSLCLNVAHDCNLRCQYCFASTGDFEGARSLMSLETGKKAIDFLIEKSGGRKNLETDFFGGEPLMNFALVKELVAYAREKEARTGKRFRFTISTNGLLLNDEIIDFINKEMSNVVLSIDGRKTVNDRMRGRIDKSGSYDSIVPKFKKLVQKRGGKEYYVRGTFTRRNLDFTEDVKHLHDLGFDRISVEPVVSEGEEYSITEGDIPEICAEYEKLMDFVLEADKSGKPFTFFHFMIDLNSGPCVIKRLKGCGCGNEYVAVTPEGDIYPCHQFVGAREWKMGNLNDKSFDSGKKREFAGNNIYSKPECLKCWAKYYCSGGCAANSARYCQSLKKPYKISCELEKKRLECAIVLAAEKAGPKEV